MPLRRRAQENVVNSGARSILRVLRNSHAVGNLIRRGEPDAVNVLCQGVRVLAYFLDRQLPIGLVDSDLNRKMPKETKRAATQGFNVGDRDLMRERWL